MSRKVKVSKNIVNSNQSQLYREVKVNPQNFEVPTFYVYLVHGVLFQHFCIFSVSNPQIHLLPDSTLSFPRYM